MIHINYKNPERIVNISLSVQINDTTTKNFNMNRSFDEPILTTFQKFNSHLTKQSLKQKGKQAISKAELIPVKEPVPIFLYNHKNEQLPLDTLNLNAWHNDFTFKIKDQSFKVAVNLPLLKKISISKHLIAGLTAIAKIDFEAGENRVELLNENSKFMWFHSGNEINEWILMKEGKCLRSCLLNECTVNFYIKLVVTPSDGERDGKQLEVISKDVVNERLDLNEFPMTRRHELTSEYLKDDK